MRDAFDDSDDALNRAEREARRDQMAGEVEAEKLRLASRSLTDLVWEAMHRGDAVRLSWQGGEAHGVPLAAIGDLVVFATDDGVRAVNMKVVGTVEIAERGVDRGSAGDRTVGSFVAWCRMAEGREVEVDLVGGRRIEGRLEVTATDHLLVRGRGGFETGLARSQVAAISVVGDLLSVF